MAEPFLRPDAGQNIFFGVQLDIPVAAYFFRHFVSQPLDSQRDGASSGDFCGLSRLAKLSRQQSAGLHPPEIAHTEVYKIQRPPGVLRASGHSAGQNKYGR